MISVCRDYEFINQFMSLPEITRYSREYGANVKTVFAPENNELWLDYSINGERIGLINMHVETGSMCAFHPYILKSAKGHYVKMCLLFFKWFDDVMPPEAVKLNTIIPAPYRATIKAAEAGGMKKEGTDRMSYRTSRKVCDRIHYGITREEIKNG